jgi:mono/diheme cytochrome c family protein
MASPRPTFGPFVLMLALVIFSVLPSRVSGKKTLPALPRSEGIRARLEDRGRYLATIGVCEACHTPPAVPAAPPAASDRAAIAAEQRFRTDPDWFRYLDPDKKMAGGVPFILRFSKDSGGVVYTRNLTPDPETGLGKWSEDEIVRVIRTGQRKDGTALFLFVPHTFFKDLAEEDARALVVYLKSLKPIRNQILERSLPFPVQPAQGVTDLVTAPQGQTQERAAYLMRSLVGCRECHSHHRADGSLAEFVGGDPADPFTGSFRLGPDLPLRQTEKGFAGFPFPGYAILYGPNLTRFGLGGDLSHVSTAAIVKAMRHGISPSRDRYGRPDPLAHVMMWQFYSSMSDQDAYAIAEYIKGLRFQSHDIGEQLIVFGDSWEAAFEHDFGEKPSDHDKTIFGKK